MPYVCPIKKKKEEKKQELYGRKNYEIPNLAGATRTRSDII